MTKGPWVFSLLSPLHPAATPQCSQTPKCLQHTHSHLHLTSLTHSRNLLLEAPPLTLWSYSCRSPPNCHITSECVLTLLSFSGFHDTSLTQLTSHCQLFSPLLPMLSAVFAQSSQMVAVSISWAFSLLRNSSNYHSHCMTSRFSAQTSAVTRPCFSAWLSYSTLISVNTSTTSVVFILPQKLLPTFSLL